MKTIKKYQQRWTTILLSPFNNNTIISLQRWALLQRCLREYRPHNERTTYTFTQRGGFQCYNFQDSLTMRKAVKKKDAHENKQGNWNIYKTAACLIIQAMLYLPLACIFCFPFLLKGNQVTCQLYSHIGSCPGRATPMAQFSGCLKNKGLSGITFTITAF